MTLPSGIQLPDDKIAALCRKYQIREMSVFGSAARGDATPDSDVDVLVELRPDARLGWEFFAIAEEMEGIVGRRVDLGTKDSLKPHARPSAQRDAVVVYAE